MKDFHLGGIKINNSLTRDIHFFSAMTAIHKPKKSVSISFTENFSCCVDYYREQGTNLCLRKFHLIKIENDWS